MSCVGDPVSFWGCGFLIVYWKAHVSLFPKRDSGAASAAPDARNTKARRAAVYDSDAHYFGDHAGLDVAAPRGGLHPGYLLLRVCLHVFCFEGGVPKVRRELYLPYTLVR